MAYQDFLAEEDACDNCWLMVDGDAPYYCNKESCDDEEDPPTEILLLEQEQPRPWERRGKQYGYHAAYQLGAAVLGIPED